MSISLDNKLVKYVLNQIQHYNHHKYWKRREIVINPKSKVNILIRLYYLFYIKRCDAYNNSSFGTNLGSGTTFKSPPILPHGPKNIILGNDLKIGENVVIMHNVTMTQGGSIVGDNVLFSTGSVLLHGRNVGNNCKIGANAVVVEDVPDNCTVVLQKPRVISQTNSGA